MSFTTHIGLTSVDEKIDHYISENETDYYEQGPIALRDLYEFVIDGVARGRFDDPATICVHVGRRIQEYRDV